MAVGQFNWSEHRPVKAEAAGSSPVSPEFSCLKGNKNNKHNLIPYGDPISLFFRGKGSDEERTLKKERELVIASEIIFYNFVWIKDLPMLYYSILDDELI
ncbi:hypothetical protein RIF29_43233 [Crotalaria pallida]|uniref:Uncharacterized protein n=1 Tax=Crotalaria pallida TaxID=3830 RepID=A0AAN9DXR7_CROPI